MLNIVIGTAAVAIAMAAPVDSAKITGVYAAEGGCAGAPLYRGVVTVNANGDAFKLSWIIGTESYDGTALLSGDVLAISFSGGRQPGTMFVRRGKGGWDGQWVMAGSSVACREHWTPAR